MKLRYNVDKKKAKHKAVHNVACLYFQCLGWQQEEQEFKVILGYIVSRRPAWTIGHSVLKKKKKILYIRLGEDCIRMAGETIGSRGPGSLL